MEWVEVRGETLEAAKEEALDQLGVAHDDAEFEVVQEPESRWLGFKKTEARVRARVRPTQPRPKKETRNSRRSRKGGGGDSRNRGGNRSKGGGNGSKGGGNRSKGGGGGGRGRQDGRSQQSQGANGGSDTGKDSRNDRGGDNQRGGQNTRSADQRRDNKRNADDQQRADNQRSAKKEATVNDDARQEAMPVPEQQAAAEEFLQGLASGFGLEATVSSSLEDDVIIGSLEGDDLGLMIGPKGGTMYAIQELARSAVQRQSDGRDTGRLMVDVAGYRERRRGALGEFAAKQAQRVIDEGVQVALEPMNSADRKAVHDAIVEIDGVSSTSEGDDPRRRVVLLPADD